MRHVDLRSSTNGGTEAVGYPQNAETCLSMSEHVPFIGLAAEEDDHSIVFSSSVSSHHLYGHRMETRGRNYCYVIVFPLQ